MGHHFSGQTLERKKPKRVARFVGTHDPFEVDDVFGGSNPLKRPMVSSEGAAFGCQQEDRMRWPISNPFSRGSSGGTAHPWKPQEGKTGWKAASLPEDGSSEGRTPWTLRRTEGSVRRQASRGGRRQGRRNVEGAMESGLGIPTRGTAGATRGIFPAERCTRIARTAALRALRGAGMCRRGRNPMRGGAAAARKKSHGRRPTRVRR